VYGAYLEILYKEQLDHAFKIFRDKAQDDIRVDLLSRLHLLELIELRAKGWKGTEVMNQYYRKKVNQYSQVRSPTRNPGSAARHVLRMTPIGQNPLSDLTPLFSIIRLYFVVRFKVGNADFPLADVTSFMFRVTEMASEGPQQGPRRDGVDDAPVFPD
jgi:hypothetical protein